MYRSILMLVLASAVSFSETVTQTDWSGGAGVPGPVMHWGTFYDTSSNIDSTEGILGLNEIIIAVPRGHVIDEGFLGLYSICAADIDGDGSSDVVGAVWTDDEIAWWENSDTSPGAFWTRHAIASDFEGAHSVYAVDLDGDGDFDVLGAASGGDKIAWWENLDGSGSAWVEHMIRECFDGARSVYADYIARYGDFDVLGAPTWDYEIIWWENSNGFGTEWLEHTVADDFEEATSVFTEDVDGDGDIDVLGAGFSAGKISWWENSDGFGITWVEHTIRANFDYAKSAIATDIDGDGDIDVLGSGGEYLPWWENSDGSGITWIEHIIEEKFDATFVVYSADIDNDGDADVLSSRWVEGATICWWENSDTSPGAVWTKHTLGGKYPNTTSICSDDVDNNGTVDLICTSVVGDGAIKWSEVFGYVEEGILESSILDAGDVGEWITFLSNSQEPAGTSVSFQFRSSTDADNMGAWSDAVFSSSTPLDGILADSTQYLQYRVILNSSDSLNTPTLEDVTFGYYQLGIGDDVSFWSLCFSENPSYSHLSAIFAVPEAGMVDLLLYDVSGRVVAEVSQEFPTGIHSLNFYGLSEGVTSA